jgi:hypothetical protein
MTLPGSKTANAQRSSFVNRRLLLLGVLLAGISGGPGGAQQAAAPSADATLADAVRVLTREKSAAEAYAVILATVGKADTGLYVQGILLYADAKAEFDGLIALLKFALTRGQDPARSEAFTGALQAAAEKRVAFTSLVKSEVVDKVPGARPGLPDVITAVPQLVKAITDAGLSIWKAFHDAGKERRDAILNEVEHLQWRSFAELAKG